ncbi:MAG: thymidylate kinase, partial [Rhodobacteraceae bacterium]
ALTRGLARQSGEDRFEDMGLEFQQKLRAGFLDLAKTYTDRCVVVDGTGSVCDVAQRVKSAYDGHPR